MMLQVWRQSVSSVHFASGLFFYFFLFFLLTSIVLFQPRTRHPQSSFFVFFIFFSSFTHIHPLFYTSTQRRDSRRVSYRCTLNNLDPIFSELPHHYHLHFSAQIVKILVILLLLIIFISTTISNLIMIFIFRRAYNLICGKARPVVSAYCQFLYF